MTIEQQLPGIIQAFCADAHSSTLNVDVDIALRVLAQAPSLRSPPVSALATPPPPRYPPHFLDTLRTIASDGNTVTLTRRAYSPVLRQSDLPVDTAVTW